ncbi:hypothetical protein [Solwaraspora sp. WMMA2065]|uniref:hypothetical protein n=1 Tax=Solwaraspora sp. WMMA2065 TaxID=3015166 RepID=UPI00259B66AB|nr:hypothetical protein [Solwaraspora sp. WMMA2065]WJK33141.1 hypothetical protein O7610_20820 [Solwaraspora sp. WMMA2065]
MNSTPEPTAAPSALDKITAALADLGQNTAAVIAHHAGVGYSTATKRLRQLEEAGHAEPFRADDGRTLWRQTTNTTTNGDDTPATGTTPHPPPPHPETPDDQRESLPEPPPTQTGTGAAAEPDETTGDAPGESPRPAPAHDTDRPTTQQTLRPTDPNSPDTPAAAEATDPGGDGTVETGDDAPGTDPAGGDTRPGHTPDPPDTRTAPATDSRSTTPHPSPTAPARRPKGTLRAAVRDVLEAHPDTRFKTSDLCKALDTANEDGGGARVSAGAVVNAVHKLVTAGVAVQVADRPATFQLAPAAD